MVKATSSGIPEYSIRLEDSDVDLLMFRGLVAGRATSHPFVFFNACSLGQAQRVASFVDGWAPATLEAGASGYVGGLWLLSDAGAAAFAARFYATFATALRTGPVTVAEVLRQVRRDFYDRGDPTFLAYVYYGDPDLRFMPAGKAAQKPDPRAEVRRVLETYKRAFESKDLALYLKVHPVAASEAKKVEDSFKQSRSHRVDLTVQKIDVTGDQAEARGRRRDEFVSAQGQKFDNEVAFVYKLRKTDAGWVIADVK